jgi:hypothetical protein
VPAPAVIWTGLLLLVFGGRLFTTDIAAQYQVAESMLGARPLFTSEYGWLVEGTRSGSYVPHGPGYSIVLLPAAGAGLLLGTPAGKAAGAATGALMSVVLILGLEALAKGFFGRIDRRRLVPVMLGCMGLIYGRMPYDVTAAGALALWGAVMMHRRRFSTAGILFGASLLVRTDSVFLLPLYWMGSREGRGYLAFLGGAVPFVLAAMSYNLYRFGNIFEDGHGQDPAIRFDPASRGIVGLLFSPGKGLTWYAPMWIPAALLCRNFRLWLPFALSLLFHGMLHDWTGGTGWGPRFLFPVLPVLFLPLLQPGAGGRIFWWLAWPALAVSLAAGFTDTNALERNLGPDPMDAPGRREVVWTFSGSPLVNTLAGPGFTDPDILGYRAAGIPGALAQVSAALLVTAAGVVLLRRNPD